MLLSFLPSISYKGRPCTQFEFATPLTSYKARLCTMEPPYSNRRVTVQGPPLYKQTIGHDREALAPVYKGRPCTRSHKTPRATLKYSKRVALGVFFFSVLRRFFSFLRSYCFFGRCYNRRLCSSCCFREYRGPPFFKSLRAVLGIPYKGRPCMSRPCVNEQTSGHDREALVPRVQGPPLYELGKAVSLSDAAKDRVFSWGILSCIQPWR